MLISRLNDHADEGALPRSDEHKTYFIFVYILFITFFFFICNDISCGKLTSVKCYLTKFLPKAYDSLTCIYLYLQKFILRRQDSWSAGRLRGDNFANYSYSRHNAGKVADN